MSPSFVSLLAESQIYPPGNFEADQLLIVRHLFKHEIILLCLNEGMELI